MDALVNERQERLAVGTHLSEQLLGEHLKVGFKEWPTWVHLHHCCLHQMCSERPSFQEWLEPQSRGGLQPSALC
eukprot:1150633-Pelagomonas_calceolata.AAC.6